MLVHRNFKVGDKVVRTCDPHNFLPVGTRCEVTCVSRFDNTIWVKNLETGFIYDGSWNALRFKLLEESPPNLSLEFENQVLKKENAFLCTLLRKAGYEI